MTNFNYIYSADKIICISRSKFMEQTDGIIYRVDNENVGFLITEKGREDILLCPVKRSPFSFSINLGGIISGAVEHVIGRHTYAPGVACKSGSFLKSGRSFKK